MELQFFSASASYGQVSVDTMRFKFNILFQKVSTLFVFFFNQGLLSFALFGLDEHLIIVPFKRR